MESRTGGTMQSAGLLVLRVGMGALLLFGHGWPKVAHFAEWAPNFANPIGVGPDVSLALVVLAEVVCAALVIVGLATRLACVPIVIFMSVAMFIQLAHKPWADRELAAVFLVPFLALLFAGGGKYSLDALIRGRR